MSDKASKFHQKIKTHGDPEKQIGTTADGKPVFIDVRELIASPDEEAERWTKTLDSRKASLVDAMANMVLENAARFIEQTYWNIVPETGKKLYATGDPRDAFEYAQSCGIEAMQDGLTTVVKHKGEVLRLMTADVSPVLRDQVSQRVTELVKKMPSHPNAQ
jgi:hypothetical protein